MASRVLSRRFRFSPPGSLYYTLYDIPHKLYTPGTGYRHLSRMPKIFTDTGCAWFSSRRKRARQHNMPPPRTLENLNEKLKCGQRGGQTNAERWVYRNNLDETFVESHHFSLCAAALFRVCRPPVSWCVPPISVCAVSLRRCV